MYLKKEPIISITDISSKIYKPKTYNEVIANPIYSTRWWQVIKEKIHNLKIYHT